MNNNKRIFNKEEQEIILAMYNNGETYKYISNIINCKSTKISEFINTQGLHKRKRNEIRNSKNLKTMQKYVCDIGFFKTIDNDIKAYWLGFLFADGSINIRHDKNGNQKGGNVELGLKSEDEYHIASFIYDLKSNNKISKRIAQVNGNTYNSSRVVINSIDMVNDLIKLKCTPNKSLTLESPNIKDNLISHFIRGYFDGDGCVGFYPILKSYVYEILGTYSILSYIKTNANIANNIRKLPNKNVYSLRISSIEAIEKFHNYIYQDKTVFLQRKYEKSLEMLKYLKFKTERSETSAMADLLD